MKPKMRLADDGNDRSIPRHVRFNVTTLEAVKPPEAGRTWLHDTACPGLAFQVTSTGARAFYFYGRIKGRPHRLKLGDFPKIGVDAARELVKEHHGDIAKGGNPAADRQRIRKGATLGEAWEKYQVKRSDRRDSTKVTDASRFDTCFDDWRNHKLASITPAAVEAKHAAIAKARGTVTANRAMQLLRRIWNVAKLPDNPVNQREIEFTGETVRHRYLSSDEINRLFAALAVEPSEIIRDFIFMCLFTGQRRGNVQSMKWDEIDMTAATWSIPPEKFKTGEPLAVPLVTPAMDILRARLATREDDCPWVFPSPRGSAAGHLMEPKIAWGHILKRAKIENLHMHDLRHSQASWLAQTGADLTTIRDMLGHAEFETTERYTHLTRKHVRAASEKAAGAMIAASNGKSAEAPKPEPQAAPAPAGASIADELVKLAGLVKDGILTAEEFATAKAKLLAR